MRSPTTAFVNTFFLLSNVIINAQTVFNDERFQQVIVRLEADAFELRDQIEALYATRCDSLSTCQQANYDNCQTLYPSPTCPIQGGYHIKSCGPSMSCSGTYDFTVSAAYIPPGASNRLVGNPTKPQIIESLCFTRELDAWFQDKRSTDQAFWSQYGLAPHSMFFGSNTGTFRIYPARHSEVCGVYDPRVRPWYVAGGSGRKNVVMVLDKSGSMTGRLLELLKEATKRVINTLTVGDRVAIVFFDSEATVVGDEDKYLFEATDENKAYLSGVVDELKATGKTNFYDAFQKAFDVLDASTSQELAVSCNTAILFLTDGKLSTDENVTEADVVSLVNRRLAISKNITGKPILLFSYSISTEEGVHEFPSKLACSVETGTWSQIDDESEIVNALSSYYLLFALGLGSDFNSDYAAWVEPYVYSTGNILGTTVSVPVYDRSKSPYLFLGVVGIDLALSTLDEALGTTDSSQSITRLAARSVARCPTFELTACQLDFYRLATSGETARCLASTCTDDAFVETQDKDCGLAADRYPSDIFINADLKGKSYSERVCCAVDGIDSTTQTCEISVQTSPSGKNMSWIIAGASVGGAAVLLCFSALLFYRCCGKGRDNRTIYRPGSEQSLPEPLAPPFNPRFKAPAPP